MKLYLACNSQEGKRIMLFRYIVFFLTVFFVSNVFSDENSSLNRLLDSQDCSDCQFSSVHLREFVLSHRDMKKIKFSDSNLSKTNLIYSDLTESTFDTVNLIAADNPSVHSDWMPFTIKLTSIIVSRTSMLPSSRSVYSLPTL